MQALNFLVKLCFQFFIHVTMLNDYNTIYQSNDNIILDYNSFITPYYPW